MKKQQNEIKDPSQTSIRRSAAITIICDIVLLIAFVAGLFVYTFQNNINIYEQNTENIISIAKANSQLMESALSNTSYGLVSAYNYCDGKTEREILDYLSIICIDDEEYQLIKRNNEKSDTLYHVYDGYSTRKLDDGTYVEVVYNNTSLSKSIFSYDTKRNGVVSYSRSFTNNTDGLSYFAVFCGVSVDDGDGTASRYFIVKPQKENRVLGNTQKNTQYNDISFAVCYVDGKYLAKDEGFKNTNFFDYIKTRNGLSEEQKKELRSSVMNNEEKVGFLTYNDYNKRECIFAYAVCAENDSWLVIVAVPVSEFVEPQMFTLLPLLIIGFLIILLFFNIYRLLMIVRELRLSVLRERVANSAKSSFLSRMSHEIRTPLNAVIGYNTIARNELVEAKTEDQRVKAEMSVIDCLVKSEIASKHLLTIINDVLDMSAIESGKVKIAHERFDFKGLINSLTTVFYSQAKSKGVDLEVVLDSMTEEWFIGDQMRVNQILTNLLSNAVKFTPEGGSVKLKINQPEAKTNASHIHFRISDTGIGMTPEYLEHLWTPFEQADSSISRRFGGTGLGLSITKTLIDLMGGKIAVSSNPGKGTTFNIDLEFERTEQPNSEHTYNFAEINALVVDDDQSTCDYIRLLFERCGARCTTVTSGVDALKAIQLSTEQNDIFTLCLVDWKMPDMDGIETVERIKTIISDNTPVIVLTAYDYSEIAERAARIGVNKFISKPLFQSTLFDLLASVCGTSSAQPKEKNERYDFAGARIILAEDNEMNMEIATNILGSAGLVVDCAWNGIEAVNLFEESAPNTYAAILMDVHMPDMDGHEATKAIRGSNHADAKTIPIIAMTADAFAENVAEAQAAGMNDHIAKPIDVKLLFQTLRKYIK